MSDPMPSWPPLCAVCSQPPLHDVEGNRRGMTFAWLDDDGSCHSLATVHNGRCFRVFSRRQGAAREELLMSIDVPLISGNDPLRRWPVELSWDAASAALLSRLMFLAYDADRDEGPEASEGVPSDVAFLRERFARSFLASDCGVYLLIDGSQVVYVGQSRSVYRRLAQHRMDSAKRWSHALFLPCDASRLSPLEGALIALLQPPLNGRQQVSAFDGLEPDALRDIAQRLVR